MRVLVALSGLAALALLLGPGLLAEEVASAPAEEAVFPASWEGHWRGPARTASRSGPARTFTMELEVRPIEGTEGHSWTIVYAEGEQRQVRPYEIRAVDEKTGHWRIDEKNSILIDAFLVGDGLHSRFAVMSSVVDVRYVLRGRGHRRRAHDVREGAADGIGRGGTDPRGRIPRAEGGPDGAIDAGGDRSPVAPGPRPFSRPPDHCRLEVRARLGLAAQAELVTLTETPQRATVSATRNPIIP